MIKNNFDWKHIYTQYEQVCVMLYYWLLNEKIPTDISGLTTPEQICRALEWTASAENLFLFFDKNEMLVGAYPISLNCFRAFAKSKTQGLFDNDSIDRQSANSRAIIQGFSLMDEMLKTT